MIKNIVEWFTNNKKSLLFVFSLTIFYGLIFIFSDFYDMPCDGFRDMAILFAQWGVICTATFALLWLLSINKYVFTILFPLITVSCAGLSYFRYTANISITPMMVDLAMINDWRTNMDVITWQLILVMILFFALSLLVVIYRWRKIRFYGFLSHLLPSALLIFLFTDIYMFAAPLSQRLPYSIYYSVANYLDSKRIISEHRKIFGGDIVNNTDSMTVVFVLGESLRAKNLQINGYERETTPLLCKETNVVSYPNIKSETGFTHTSIPYILTRADSLNEERGYTEKSFIDLLKRGGYHTSWIANQESVSTFIYFMKECDILDYVNGGKSLYMFDKWLDGDVLPSLDRELARNVKHNFILIHTIGSHWWYRSHYPDSMELFRPVTESRVISSNNAEQMRNTYDNTIVYSDYFWNQVINRLRNRKAIMIYLSDHSESLGENGHFTHGVVQDATREPACFVWYSDIFANCYPEKIKALKDNRNDSLSTSFVFHSILDVAGIESLYKIKSESIFR